ncbi:rod-binding protein [Xanthobacter aminoxidans]|uniref:rod-binding protein n=1 Tax=Xanthobacter aminoxidans TaxID=186280 RepID=UPI003727941C
MGISPPTDLVFDVMQAADAARARQVMGKLQALTPAADGAFRTELDTVAEAKAVARTEKLAARGDKDAAAAAAALIPPGVAFSGASLTGLKNAHALGPHHAGGATGAAPLAGTQKSATPGAASLQKFEAMVLSQFLDTMMPTKGATSKSSMFGAGTAGDTWKSLLTQKVGEEAARAGGIGLAARLGESSAVFARAKGGAA